MQKTKIIIFLLTIIYISSLSIAKIEFEGCDEKVYEIDITFDEALSKNSKVVFELSSPKMLTVFVIWWRLLNEVICYIADKLSDDTIEIKSVKVDDTPYTPIDLITSKSNVTCEGDKDIKNELSNSNSSNIKINIFLLFFIFFIV